MATTPQSFPPNRPPAPRSLFGPVVLISLGIIALLVTTGKIPWVDAARVFAQYWPLLLILWGIAKLIDHYQARKHGYRAPGMGAGGAFLFILLMIFGLSATAAHRVSSHVNWDDVPEEFGINDDDGFALFMGKKFEYTDQMAQAIPANGTVKVICERGSIKITPSTDNQAHVTVHKVVYADDQAAADKYKEVIAPRITADGTTLNLDFSRHGDWKGGRTDLEVAVPKSIPIDLMTLRGDIDVRDRDAYVKTHTSRGSISLENIKGNSEHQLRHGDFVAKNINGDLAIEGRIDDTQIANVTGTVSLNGDYIGDLQLSKVGKSVRFKSSRTDMEFVRLDGDMTMSGSELTIRNMMGPFRIDTRSKDIHLDDYSGDVRIENTNAEIDLHPKQLGNTEVQNRSGRIRLVVPGNANFEVNARADRGEVDTDFNLNKNEDRRAQSLSGVINRGGPKVQLNTEHGSIAIFKTEGERAKEDASDTDSDRSSDSVDAKIERKLEQQQRKIEKAGADAERKAADAERKAREAEKKMDQF
jgi:Putative adhesin